MRLETSLSVKSSIVTKEDVTVARGGKVVDERSRETKENNYYASSTSEIWEPVGIIHRPRNIKPFDSSDDSRPNSNASSDQGYTTNTSSNHVLRERGGASTAGCPICEDNDPECARRCLAGLTGLGGEKVAGVRTTTSAVSVNLHEIATKSFNLAGRERSFGLRCVFFFTPRGRIFVETLSSSLSLLFSLSLS